MNFIAIVKEKYRTTYSIQEYSTAADLLNAILSGEVRGEFIIARRLALSVAEAREVPLPSPDPVPVVQPVAVSTDEDVLPVATTTDEVAFF